MDASNMSYSKIEFFCVYINLFIILLELLKINIKYLLVNSAISIFIHWSKFALSILRKFYLFYFIYYFKFEINCHLLFKLKAFKAKLFFKNYENADLNNIYSI